MQNSLKQKKERTESEKLLINVSFDKYMEYIKEKSSYNGDFYVYRKLENHYYNPFIVKKIQEKVEITSHSTVQLAEHNSILLWLTCAAPITFY